MTSSRPVSTPEILAPLGELGETIRALDSVDQAWSLLLRERLYGLADATWFTSLSLSGREELSKRLSDARLAETARLAVRESHWEKALRALNEAGLSPITLKGFALGRTLYNAPVQRPSLDLDLIIDVKDVERAHEVMRALEWELPFGVRGQYTSHQFTWTTGEAGPTRAMIDFHWRITNRPSLSRSLTHSQLMERAVEIPFGGIKVLAIHPIDALLHAVIHIVAHHRGEEIPALWFYDIALLERALSPKERVLFTRALAANGISALCSEIWRQAQTSIGFVPSAETRWLLNSVDESDDLWQKMPDNRATEIIADLVALRAQDRLHYLRELVLPNERSMRIAYGEELESTPLWMLHARRLLQLGVRQKNR